MEPKRRFYSDGKGIWYIDRLWPLANGLPVEDLLVAQVPVLDEVCWFSQEWNARPTCRAVIDHCRRILDADMTHPVIVGPGNIVLDGVHRIAKAVLHGQSTVHAVRILELPPPDETINPDDPRYESPQKE